MLVLGSRLNDTPVMSLQTGTRLARTSRPIIDPSNLTIVAFEIDGPLISERPSLLRTADIRELGNVGMIIDSNDEIIGLHDVIKIEELYKLNFPLLGMAVIDEHKRKLGKVEDYTLETGNFVIQQLNVKRGILKAITDAGLLVHRSQIVEINDNEIIVKSPSKKSPEPVMQASRREYVNPFRSSENPTPAPIPEPEA